MTKPAPDVVNSHINLAYFKEYTSQFALNYPGPDECWKVFVLGTRWVQLSVESEGDCLAWSGQPLTKTNSSSRVKVQKIAEI